MFDCFFFQAEDGIRDLVRSRGLGDVYKRQARTSVLGQFEGVKVSNQSIGVASDSTGAATVAIGLSLIHI